MNRRDLTANDAGSWNRLEQMHGDNLGPTVPVGSKARKVTSMKTVPQITADEAAALVPEGAVLMAGGFGMTGNPVHLLHALAERGTQGLTYIGNNVGEPGLGGGRLLRNGQLKKAIGSFSPPTRRRSRPIRPGRSRFN